MGGGLLPSPLMGEGQGGGDSPHRRTANGLATGHPARRAQWESSREGRSPSLENNLPGRAGGIAEDTPLVISLWRRIVASCYCWCISRKPVDHALPRMRLPHATHGPLLDLCRLRLLHLRPRGRQLARQRPSSMQRGSALLVGPTSGWSTRASETATRIASPTTDQQASLFQPVLHGQRRDPLEVPHITGDHRQAPGQADRRDAEVSVPDWLSSAL